MEKASDFFDACTSATVSIDRSDKLKQLLLSSLDVEWTVQRFNNSVKGTEISCQNLHSVLPTQRGDGKEGIVFVTPVDIREGNFAYGEWRQHGS